MNADLTHSEMLAVLLNETDNNSLKQMAEKLGLDCFVAGELDRTKAEYFLTYRDNCLCLIDRSQLKKGGMKVEIEPRPGEQRSWPAPKDGALAQALGRKTRTVIDATTGWAQDSLHIFRMGYDLSCIERSPLMQALIEDGFRRLANLDWMLNLQLSPPKLLQGNAIELLADSTLQADCVYLDPMFPPKRKKSALTRKSMSVLRDLLGDDLDKEQLFASAMLAASKRVVVKCPDDADYLGGKPQMSYRSKLLRYDVYLKPTEK